MLNSSALSNLTYNFQVPGFTADDLGQEAQLEVLQCPTNQTPEYKFIAARRRLIRLSQRSRRPQFGGDRQHVSLEHAADVATAQPSPEDIAIQNDLLARALALIAKMNPLTRRILLDNVCNDMTLRTIARREGLPLARVQRTKDAALAELRAALL